MPAMEGESQIETGGIKSDITKGDDCGPCVEKIFDR